MKKQTNKNKKPNNKNNNSNNNNKNNNNNNNNENKKIKVEVEGNYNLFRLVFGNIVLFRIIFKYVRNYRVKLNSRKELLGYSDLKYVQILDYNCSDELEYGDLKRGTSLKEIVMSCTKLKSGDIIPYGVNTLNFKYSGMNLPFSELPSTVNTITNASFGYPYISYGEGDDEIMYQVTDTIIDYNIPPNITSISFINSMANISGVGKECFKIPNTMKELQFDHGWYNNSNELRVGDLPDGLTKLSMPGYSFNKKGIIPNTVKHLCMSFNNFSNVYSFLDVLPPNIKTLNLNSCYGLSNNLQLFRFDTITTLDIQLYGKKPSQNSLPQSVTNLSISGIKGSIQADTIPHKVKVLKILFQYPQFETNFISKKSIPSSVVTLFINKCICKFSDILVDPTSTLLNHLEIINNNVVYKKDELFQLASTLPTTITSLNLSDQIKPFNIKFSENIKKINYKPN